MEFYSQQINKTL